MILNNVQQIRAEDFPEEMQETIARLGEILNPFMQQVVELSDNRIDFDNTTQILKTVQFTVDEDGTPVLNNKLNTEKTNVNGFKVISAFNQTNSTGYPTSEPFISYTPLAGTTVQVDNITGLLPNNTYNLTIIIY